MIYRCRSCGLQLDIDFDPSEIKCSSCDVPMAKQAQPSDGEVIKVETRPGAFLAPDGSLFIPERCHGNT